MQSPQLSKQYLPVNWSSVALSCSGGSTVFALHVGSFLLFIHAGTGADGTDRRHDGMMVTISIFLDIANKSVQYTDSHLFTL